MDGKHICLAHYQQTASGPKHSSLEEASALQSTKKQLSVLLYVILSTYTADTVKVSRKGIFFNKEHPNKQIFFF